MLSKNNIVKITESIAIASITAIGLSIGGELGITVISGIGISLASNLISRSTTRIKEKWINSPFGVLNHDIQNSLLRAYVKSLKFMRAKYLGLYDNGMIPENERESILAIKSFYDELINHSSSQFLDAIQNNTRNILCHDYLENSKGFDVVKFLNAVGVEEYLDGYSIHFKNFFLDNILTQIQMFFEEELKLDDKENNRAWRAFQRIFLEGIYSEIHNISNNQLIIQKDLEQLHLIENKLNQIQNSIDRNIPSKNSVTIIGGSETDLNHFNKAQFLIYFRLINQDLIQQYITDDHIELKQISLNYYLINDYDELLFKVVCNNLDIINNRLLRYSKHRLIEENKTAVWVLGKGGTGKSTFLVRLAVSMALDESNNCFWINFENLPIDFVSVFNNLFNYIQQNYSKRVYLFIDNASINPTAIEYLINNIQNIDSHCVLIFAERENRFNNLVKENFPVYIPHQVNTENIFVHYLKEHKNKIYSKLYDLIGENNSEVWETIKQYGINTDLDFVYSTYKILYSLKKKNVINYQFDWREYENLVKYKIPNAEYGYKYIAIMSYYGIRLSLGLFSKILSLSSSDIQLFINIFKDIKDEPISIHKFEYDEFNSEYFIKTKHEIVSEIYFIENNLINKEDLLVEIIKSINFDDHSEYNLLTSLFHTKNLEDRFVNLTKILANLLNSKSPFFEKMKRKPYLYNSLVLFRYNYLKKENSLIEAVTFLEDMIKCNVIDIRSIRELLKVYLDNKNYSKFRETMILGKQFFPNNHELVVDNFRFELSQGNKEFAEQILLDTVNIPNKDTRVKAELAKFYIMEKRYEEAISLLNAGILLNPKDISIRLVLAELYLLMDDFEKCKDILNVDIPGASNCISMVFLANIYMDRSNYTQAELLLQNAARIHPNFLPLSLAFIRLYRFHNRKKEIKQVIDKLNILTIKDEKDRTLLADTLIYIGNYKAAEKIMDGATNKDKYSLMTLSKLYLTQHNFQDATKLLSSILEMEDQNIHAKTMLASINRRVNNFDEAISLLRQVMVTKPEDITSRFELIYIYLRLNKKEEIIELLQEILTIDKRNVKNKSKAALICIKINEYDKALELLNEIQYKDMDIQTKTILAILYRRIGNVNKALEILLDNSKSHNSDLLTLCELAVIYKYQKNYKLFEDILNKILQEYPYNIYARTNLARIYQLHNKFNDAEAVLEILIQQKNIIALSEILIIYSRTGKIDKAFQTFDSIINENTNIDKKHQASFNNLFEMCKIHNLISVGKKYFEMYQDKLDIKNINKYKKIFLS